VTHHIPALAGCALCSTEGHKMQKSLYFYSYTRILLTVQCISVQFVLITNLKHFFNALISLLYMFRATQCSSSGESIVSIHHLVYITVCRWSVCRSETCVPTTYTQWHIPDDVLIQLILLMMSTGLLETCTEVK